MLKIVSEPLVLLDTRKLGFSKLYTVRIKKKYDFKKSNKHETQKLCCETDPFHLMSDLHNIRR